MLRRPQQSKAADHLWALRLAGKDIPQKSILAIANSAKLAINFQNISLLPTCRNEPFALMIITD